MRRLALRTAVAIAAFLLAGPHATASPTPASENGYRKPSRAIQEVLDAPLFPSAWISPARNAMLLGDRPGYPPLSDLAAPMLRLAGLRIDPATSGPHRAAYWTGLQLMRLPGGEETRIALPAGPRPCSLSSHFTCNCCI